MKVSFYVVQYNKPEFMKLQYSLINTYCNNEFEYIIVNNAKDEANSKIFHDFCVTNNIREIQTFQDRIPTAQDHSRCLKYIFDNYISSDESDFRIVLDHDMFPYWYFDIGKLMDSYDIGGIKLGHPPYYLSSFILIFSKNVDLNNVPIDIYNQQDATMWTYGINNKYKIKWLKHTAQGNREIRYIFKNSPTILNNYTNEKITFQFMEQNWLHYWQGSGWNNNNPDFHKEKLTFIKLIINNVEVNKLLLDNNIFYEKATMDAWIDFDNYRLNKLYKNESI